MVKTHERNCCCYDCQFTSRRQGAGLPSTVRPLHGPFSRAIHEAMPVKRGVRPCPFCLEGSLMPEGVAGRNCLFPLTRMKDGHLFCPTHLFSYEWTDHFIDNHYHGVTSVEALYRAMWKTYMETHPGMLTCPVVGFELPVQYHNQPLIKPPGKIQHVVEHMQVAVGFVETLHIKSCFQRCCAVCGATVEGRQSRPGTAAPGNRAYTSVISGQWGVPVDWRAHILKHHIHRILMASAKVLQTVSGPLTPINTDPCVPRVNPAREARLAREAMRKASMFKRPTTARQADSKVDEPYRHFTAPSTLLPGTANESLFKVHTGEAQEDGTIGHQVVWENCWRWRGPVGPGPQPPSRALPRFKCPYENSKPDYLVTGRVRPDAFYVTCKMYNAGVKTDQTPPPYCTASFTEREMLIQHLVRYHGISLVHSIDESDPSAYVRQRAPSHPGHQASDGKRPAEAADKDKLRDGERARGSGGGGNTGLMNDKEEQPRVRQAAAPQVAGRDEYGSGKIAVTAEQG